MKLKISLILAFLILAFTGCSEGKSVQDCRRMEFKGITVIQENSTVEIYCSNGQTVKINDEFQVITSSGLQRISWKTGEYANIPQNMIFIDFEKGIQPFKGIGIGND